MVTGRDLIIYILKNKLEDEVFFEDERIPGLMTIEEVAVKCNVGVETVKAWYLCGFKRGVMIGDKLYFPVNLDEERRAEDA